MIKYYRVLRRFRKKVFLLGKHGTLIWLKSVPFLFVATVSSLLYLLCLKFNLMDFFLIYTYVSHSFLLPSLSLIMLFTCNSMLPASKESQSHSWTKRILSHVMEIVYAADRLFSNRSLSHLYLSIVQWSSLCSSLIIHSSRLLVLSPIASKVGVGFSSSSISKKKEVNIGKLDKSQIARNLQSGGER